MTLPANKRLFFFLQAQQFLRAARRVIACGAVLGAPFLLAGCSGGGPAPELPLRYLAEGRATEAWTQRLDLSGAVAGIGSEMAITDEGIKLETIDGNGSIALPIAVNADAFNVVRVRMRVDRGGQFRVGWASDVDPHISRMNKSLGIPHPLGEVGVWNTYELRRADLDTAPWAGNIHRIHIFPADGASVADIGEVELYRDPTAPPARITLANTTREAVYGRRPAWTVTVPRGGQFLAHVGIADPGKQEYVSGGALFSLTAQVGEGPVVPLFRQEVLPGQVAAHREWIPVAADLSAYGGKTISLGMDVDNRTLVAGDHAYWADPIVTATRHEIPVIIISCDTLRADHLSLYGYPRNTTPFLKAWAAQQAVVFEDAYTPAAWTLPAHMSMLTGLAPTTHKVDEGRRLARDITSLPEFMRSLGYQTGGFTGHDYWLAPKYGFSDGFSTYSTPDFSFRHIYNTMDLAETWLEQGSGKQRFLFFHNYDVHSKLGTDYRYPYESGDPEFKRFSDSMDSSEYFKHALAQGLRGYGILEAQFVGAETFSKDEEKFLVASYDDSIQMVDYQLGYLIDVLMAQGLYDDALIIISADHGETLGERNHYGHYGTHEEVIRIPLIVKFPRGAHAGRRFEGMVTLMDIVPTVLDVLGEPDRLQTDGVSLKAMLEGAAGPHAIHFSEKGRHWSVQTDGVKVHREHKADPETYFAFDLKADPGEANPLPVDQVPDGPKLKAMLDERYPRTPFTAVESVATPDAVSGPTAEELEALKALGYLGVE